MIIMVEWTPKLVTIYKNVVKNADFCQELTLFAAVKHAERYRTEAKKYLLSPQEVL